MERGSGPIGVLVDLFLLILAMAAVATIVFVAIRSLNTTSNVATAFDPFALLSEV